MIEARSFRRAAPEGERTWRSRKASRRSSRGSLLSGGPCCRSSARRSGLRRPEPKDGITYGMPGFLVGGRGLVGYMAFDRHYSFFPMSPAAIDAHRDALGDLVTGKGTISFAYDRRLPVMLVKKVVKTRLAEVAPRR